MSLTTILKMPLWAAEILGSSKSFLKNPLIGDPRLNEKGLHRWRVRTAARLASSRRARLAVKLDPADVVAFNRDGFLLKRGFLEPERYARLKEEVFSGTFEAREMRQGQTVSRMIPLPPSVLKGRPVLRRLLSDAQFVGMIRYAASQGGQPLYFLQTVIADPARPAEDPQTALHADTFHPTSKAWLFLQDVGEDDGPFSNVPGSHRLTPERLAWEYEQSLTARDDARHHHALGSFRVWPQDLERMKLPAPIRVAVPENTLVVADTFGFHARTPSTKATLRAEVHAYMRRNPFLPWTGLDPKAMPGIAGRELDIFLRLEDFVERRFGRHHIWRPVGRVAVDAPAQI